MKFARKPRLPRVKLPPGQRQAGKLVQVISPEILSFSEKKGVARQNVKKFSYKVFYERPAKAEEVTVARIAADFRELSKRNTVCGTALRKNGRQRLKEGEGPK